MELIAAKLLGILLGASFALLLLSRRPAPVGEREEEAGEDDFIYQVTPDAIRRGALPAKNLIDKN